MDPTIGTDVGTNREIPRTGSEQGTLGIRRGRIVRWMVGIVFGVLCAYFVSRTGNPTEIWEALRLTPLHPLFWTITLGYLAFPLRVEQWRLLLDAPASATRLIILQATCLGHAASVFLPFRGGEFVKAVYVARRTTVSLPRVFVSVFLSRLQDLPPILAIVAALLMFAPNIPVPVVTSWNSSLVKGHPPITVAPCWVFLWRAYWVSSAGLQAVDGAGG